MSVTGAFNALVDRNGSFATYHRENWEVDCPCKTVDGFRDPEWHFTHPEAPVCNEEAKLSGDTDHLTVKGFIQPIQSTRATRLTSEYLVQMFGRIEIDDHLGIFPVNYHGSRLEFRDWSQEGNEYVEYHGHRFQVVNANLIPDPSDGNPEHHWEVALRLLESV